MPEVNYANVSTLMDQLSSYRNWKFPSVHNTVCIHRKWRTGYLRLLQILLCQQPILVNNLFIIIPHVQFDRRLRHWEYIIGYIIGGEFHSTCKTIEHWSQRLQKFVKNLLSLSTKGRNHRNLFRVVMQADKWTIKSLCLRPKCKVEYTSTVK